MTRIPEPNLQALCDLEYFIVWTWNKQCQCLLCIRHGVHRLHQRVAGTFAFSVLPLCLKLLDMGGILQHDLTQLGGGIRRKNLSLKPFLCQKRQQTGMIDMRVGDKHIIDLRRLHRELLILIDVRSLLHTTVHQDTLVLPVNKMTAARNFMGRTDKFQLHLYTPFCMVLKP